MKILFLVPYPLDAAPSQRFRFEQYLHLLRQRGDMVITQSFLDDAGWAVVFKKGKYFAKGVAVVKGFLRRLIVLSQVRNFDWIFIHREATPFGPPFIEWVIARLFRKKIIYDFDDAIWLPDNPGEPMWQRFLKYRKKVRLICGWSQRVSCGNAYLANYSKMHNAATIINPTTIDTQHKHNPRIHRQPRDTKQLTIGWTGSHSTLPYLHEIETIIQAIGDQFANVRFLIIADRPPELIHPSLTFLPWRLATEVDDLMNMDIGLMPLPDNEWTRGKCGFKILQYLSLGIPTVASPVGVNQEMITPGINGLLARDPGEWIKHLTFLINNADDRERIGRSGRQFVEQHYSVNSNSATFLSLFD